MKIIRKTKSVCPVCLASIDAELVENNKEVILKKTCSEHGDFSSVVWRGKPHFLEWSPRQEESLQHLRPLQLKKTPCPQNCGICPEHKQSSCTVLLELTSACNLSCPVCFASSKSTKETDTFLNLETLLEQLQWIKTNAGEVILQLSGGEPTLYPSLIELVYHASQLFPAVQLNTNGILLAENENLAFELKKAGLSWVFLQFDACCDEINKKIRGKKLLDIKKKAIENCRKAGLSVVLVSVLIKEINDDKIGELLDFALSYFPVVKGIHLQPMTRSGRNLISSNIEHLTLPEVISNLIEQSKNRVKKEHIRSSDCEHELCSFHARYFVDKNLTLEYIRGKNEKSCCDTNKDISLQNILRTEAPQRSVSSVIRSWQGKEVSENKETKIQGLEAFDDFIEKAKRQTFSITCMTFQDVHTLDLQRLQQCCIHIYSFSNAQHRLIPFCAYNLTSLEGKSLYRNN